MQFLQGRQACVGPRFSTLTTRELQIRSRSQIQNLFFQIVLIDLLGCSHGHARLLKTSCDPRRIWDTPRKLYGLTSWITDSGQAVERENIANKEKGAMGNNLRNPAGLLEFVGPENAKQPPGNFSLEEQIGSLTSTIWHTSGKSWQIALISLPIIRWPIIRWPIPSGMYGFEVDHQASLLKKQSNIHGRFKFWWKLVLDPAWCSLQLRLTSWHNTLAVPGRF